MSEGASGARQALVVWLPLVSLFCTIDKSNWTLQRSRLWERGRGRVVDFELDLGLSDLSEVPTAT